MAITNVLKFSFPVIAKMLKGVQVRNELEPVLALDLFYKLLLPLTDLNGVKVRTNKVGFIHYHVFEFIGSGFLVLMHDCQEDVFISSFVENEEDFDYEASLSESLRLDQQFIDPSEVLCVNAFESFVFQGQDLFSLAAASQVSLDSKLFASVEISRAVGDLEIHGSISNHVAGGFVFIGVSKMLLNGVLHENLVNIYSTSDSLTTEHVKTDALVKIKAKIALIATLGA